uniref:Troponin I2, fast skeletal type n=1 Tax=Oreochromis niloticus TaxID=8128 RepID=A0A669E732_ORENI
MMISVLQSLILQIAMNWIEQEKKETDVAKEAYMAEHCPPPDLSGDQAALMEVCKKLHAAIDKIDEERYDAEAKVQKADKEIEDLKIKVVDLRGVKKPALKKVRMSADTMLQALLGSKHKVTMDLRANLKQVKKEVKEEVSSQTEGEPVLMSMKQLIINVMALTCTLHYQNIIYNFRELFLLQLFSKVLAFKTN